MNKLYLTSAGVALLLAGAASAQPHGGRAADTDGDGRISRAEAVAAQKALFATLDADKNGRVDRAETQAAAAQAEARHEERRKQQREARAQRLLGADGVLTAAEAEQLALERFAKQDRNGDGFVSADERRAMVQEWRERRGGRGGA